MGADDAAGAGAAAGLTLARLFQHAFRLFAPTGSKVVGPERRLSYAELAQRDRRLARAMASGGLAECSRIVVLSHPCPEFVAALGVSDEERVGG